MSAGILGPHATSDVANFMGLTRAVNLPTLNTDSGLASPVLPTPQLTSADQLSGWTDIPPERQGVDLGQIDDFKYILNDNDTCTDLFAMVTLDGLNPGLGGSNPRYPDDPIAASVEKVIFQYGRDLQEFSGDEIHFNFVQSEDHTDFNRLAQLRGYSVPLGERIDNARAPRTYAMRLPFWWTQRLSDAWHQWRFRRETRIRIVWRPQTQVLQQEGANTQPTPMNGTQYIMNHWLRFRVMAISEATKQKYTERISDMGTAGWLHLIENTERLTQQIHAGNTRHVIQLNTFRKYGYNLRWVIRPVSALTANYMDNDRWRKFTIRNVQLTISGRQFLPRTDKFWLTHAVDEAVFRGSPEHDIFNIPFSDHPDLTAAAMGGIDFSMANTPQIVIETEPLPESCFVDFFLQCHNYIRLVLVGNNTGAESVQPL